MPSTLKSREIMKLYKSTGQIFGRSGTVELLVQCPNCRTMNKVMASESALKGQLLCSGCMIPEGEHYDIAFDGDVLSWEVTAMDSLGREHDTESIELALREGHLGPLEEQAEDENDSAMPKV